MDLVLIRLVDMRFNSMFSDPHCRYFELEVDLVLDQSQIHHTTGGILQD